MFHGRQPVPTLIKFLAYLDAALGCLWKMGAPISITLPLLEVNTIYPLLSRHPDDGFVQEIERVVPKIKRIWEFSSMAMQGGTKIAERDLLFLAEVRQGLAAGFSTLSGAAIPEYSRDL